MASKIILKKSSVASKVPVAGDLEYGELAINYTDSKLYFKKADGSIDAFTSAAASAPVTSVGGNIGDVTDSQLLASIKNVDGASSGLDADLLDGNHASAFYLASNPNGYTSNTGTVTSVGATSPLVSSGGTAPSISIPAANASTNGYMTSAYAAKLDGIAAGATNVTNTNQLTNGAGYITSAALASYLPLSGGSLTGPLNVNRRRLSFSSSYNDANHSIYNNYDNIDGEGIWDGVKMNVYNGLQIRTGNASGVTPFLAFDLSSSLLRLGTALQVGTASTYDNPGGWGANIVASGTYHSRFRLKATSYNSSGDRETYLWLDNTVGTPTGIWSNASTFNFNGSISTLQVNGNTVLHAGNYTSYSPSLTGSGASGTWGINITGNAATITSQANSATITASTGVNASHIVQRDGNGYIYANHINFNTSETENPTINSFITSNGDGWSRKSSLAHVKNSIRGVADGTWGINVTGNAATAANAFRAVSAGSYGSGEVYGSNNGWSGLRFNTPNSVFMVRDTDSYSGMYKSNSTWIWAFNESGSLVTGTVPWTSVSGRPTNVSSFTNDSGYITSGGSISGSSRFLAHVDGPRNLSDRPPNWAARTAIFDFVGAGTGNGAGNWAGVLTFVPWDGTSGSTGDSSYQLSFANQSGVNASGPARLSIRNGINSTWNSWQEVLTSSNYNSYSPTLTGGGASGTWGINITGSSASTTGNAATATTLQTARTINGVSFNGSANISVNLNNSLTFNNGGAGGASGSTFNGGGALTVSYNTVGAPSTTGTNASGTWSINVTGSAGSASSATNATNATNVAITNDTTTNATYYPAFMTATSGNGGVRVSSTKLTYNPSTGAFISTTVAGNSDARLKTNWRDLAQDFIEQLAKVKAGIYDRTDYETLVTQVGVPAQELQRVLPHAVVADEKGMLSVAYGNAALVSAVKLAQKVVEQEKRIKRLEAMIEKLIGE